MTNGVDIVIPDYPSVAGQRFPLGSLKSNDLRLRICNTNSLECKEYVKILESEGFTKCVERSIPSSCEYSRQTNLFYTCVKADVSVFVFWDCSINTVFITAEKGAELPLANETSMEKLGGKILLTQISVTSGMFYVIRLADGTFVCIDGGISDQTDLSRAYEFFKLNSTGKPVISTWFFTHSHVDHIELATEFIKKYSAEVETKAFSYQFPDCDKIKVSMEDCEKMHQDILRLENAISTAQPSAKIYTAHTGQVYHFAGASVEVLYSPDNTYPYPYFSFNELSLVLRLKVKDGKTVLFMGDCMGDGCRNIAHTYGDYLKSDILQVTHHGLIGGDVFLYGFVNPKICLWPTPENRFSGKLEGQKFQWCIGEGGCDYNAYLRDDCVAKRLHYSHGKDVTFTLK